MNGNTKLVSILLVNLILRKALIDDRASINVKILSNKKGILVLSGKPPSGTTRRPRHASTSTSPSTMLEGISASFYGF